VKTISVIKKSKSFMRLHYTNINYNLKGFASVWSAQMAVGLLWDIFYHWTSVHVSMLC